jgi:hypothetical protein
VTAPNNWTDPELEDLFREDGALHQTARVLHTSRPEAEIDPDFQQRLRAQLMQAAESRPVRRRSARTQPARGLRRPIWMRLGARHLAWGGAGLGLALTAATVVALLAGNPGPGTTQTVVATSPVAAEHLVSPNNTILVSFNQPMDHSAVESGLHIEPATQVTTAWQGNDLVITPVHHLAGNTPYSVTIPQTALVASSGAHATAPLQINFGTAPTPPPTVGNPRPPLLTQVPLGAAQGSGVLLFAPDGGVVTNAVAPSGTATPTPSARPSPSATPKATPSPSPSPATPSPVATSPTPSLTGGPTLIEFPVQPGSPLVLGPAATAAAYSPDGSLLASAVASTGGSDILVSRADGTNQSTLTHSAAPVVAIVWTSASKVEYATAQSVRSVDLSGAEAAVVTDPPGTLAALSPAGAFAYLAPSGGTPGRLLAVASGAVTVLAGNEQAGDVAFSGDGSTMAWIDRSSPNQVLMAAPMGRTAAAIVSILDAGSGLGPLALNQDGSQVAYDEQLGNGTGRLVVAQLPTGTPIAVGDGASQMVFAPIGGTLAVRPMTQQSPTVALDELPGASGSTGPAVPAAASQVLHAFLDAQVAGNRTALQGLTAPGVVNATLPQSGLSRALLIDAVRNSDGTIDAIATVLVDPTSSRPAALAAEERVTLAQSGGSYLVKSVNAAPLHPLTPGPHVIGVTSTEQNGPLIAQVGFDSDLAVASVPGAIIVQNAAGKSVPVTVTYDENTRTATVTVASAPSGAVSVVVGTAIRDVNGQSPPAPFTAPLSGT